VAASYTLFTRTFFFIFSGIAVWWGLINFPVFWHDSATQRMAGRIIVGDLFKPEILNQQIPSVSSIEHSTYCQPAAVRSAAIIRLRMVEADNLAGAPSTERLNALRGAIRRSLSCAPADPFLWLVLYWVESTTSGSQIKNLNYLRMSYQLGANEGWIALKRNPLTFALPDPLPADLEEYAMNEFVGLVKMGSYQEATDIIAGPAKRFRQQLLLRLVNISEDSRRAFATILYTKLDDVAVPGIVRGGRRP
jgi:hypothetical protein